MQVTIMISSIQRRIRSSVHPAYFNFYLNISSYRQNKQIHVLFYLFDLNRDDLGRIECFKNVFFLAIIKILGIEREDEENIFSWNFVDNTIFVDTPKRLCNQ